MIRGRLGRCAAALAVCAGLACVARCATADVITYSDEIPGKEFYPTIIDPLPPGFNLTLGTLGPMTEIPVERIITGATLSGTWLPPTGSHEGLAGSQILANGVKVAEFSKDATLPAGGLPWSYTLPGGWPGGLESLRSNGIELKMNFLSTGGIALGPTRLDVETVPEPGTIALWSVAGATCLGIGLWRRRRV